MKFLARIFVSVEKLFKNPVAWFERLPWAARIFWVLLLIPLISGASIFWYQQWASHQSPGDPSVQDLKQEIDSLKLSMQQLHDSEMEELAYLTESLLGDSESSMSGKSTNSLGEDILGVQDEQITENLKERIKNLQEKFDTSQLVYAKTNGDPVPVYKAADISSAKIGELQAGSFYPTLDSQEKWQQIALTDGSLGWVEKNNIIQIPAENEKNN